jgi:hypothetical protein
MALILPVQTDEFWQDITLPMLETVRRRLRALVKLIEFKKRPIVYSDLSRDQNRSRRDRTDNCPIKSTARARTRAADPCQSISNFPNFRSHGSAVPIAELNRKVPLRTLAMKHFTPTGSNADG